MEKYDPIIGEKPVWYAALNGQAYAYNIGLGYANEGILAPHIEFQDTCKNREKVVSFLNENIGREGLVPIKDIVKKLKLTEQFVIAVLEDYGLEITEEYD